MPSLFDKMITSKDQCMEYAAAYSKLGDEWASKAWATQANLLLEIILLKFPDEYNAKHRFA